MCPCKNKELDKTERRQTTDDVAVRCRANHETVPRANSNKTTTKLLFPAFTKLHRLTTAAATVAQARAHHHNYHHHLSLGLGVPKCTLEPGRSTAWPKNNTPHPCKDDKMRRNLPLQNSEHVHDAARLLLAAAADTEQGSITRLSLTREARRWRGCRTARAFEGR